MLGAIMTPDQKPRSIMDLSGDEFKRASLEFGRKMMDVAFETGPFWRRILQVTAEQKLANVESQIAACMRGATDVITCPYCGEQVKQGNDALCCADMGLTVRAILRRQAQQECIETAERIAENMARMN